MKVAFTALRVARKVLVGSIVLSVTVGCSAASAVATSRLNDRSPGAPSGVPGGSDNWPLPRSLVTNLPPGTFYILAGPNPESYDIWRVSRNGHEVQLTYNRIGYGISSLGASPAGVVMADAKSGFDELARLAPSGPVFLPDGRGSSPSINALGEISYIIPGNSTFKLMVRNNFTSRAHVLYSQKSDMTADSWGPKRSLAVVSGGHYPGTKGPMPKLLVIGRNGDRATILTSLGSLLGNVVWGQNSAGLAVSSWNGGGAVIYGSRRRFSLPAGWSPATWNYAGTELLLWGPARELGLWSPERPTSIKLLGSMRKGVSVGQFVWLNKPPRL